MDLETLISEAGALAGELEVLARRCEEQPLVRAAGVTGVAKRIRSEIRGLAELSRRCEELLGGAGGASPPRCPLPPAGAPPGGAVARAASALHKKVSGTRNNVAGIGAELDVAAAAPGLTAVGQRRPAPGGTVDVDVVCSGG